MTHDPLCPYVQVAHQRDHVACQCDLIAKVREDERDGIDAVRLRTAFNEQGYRDGHRDMLAKCIEAVESITEIAPVMNFGFEGDPKPYPLESGCYECRGEWYGADAAFDAALAALRALQEKP